jgi:hypothetical protein
VGNVEPVDKVIRGCGEPYAATANEVICTSGVRSSDVGDVKTGAIGDVPTTRVKSCVAVPPNTLVAEKVIPVAPVYVPLGAVGETVSWPLPLSKLTPGGSCPEVVVALRVGAGVPDATTVKAGPPGAIVALLWLVIVGMVLTVTMTVWVPFGLGLIPFVAINGIEYAAIRAALTGGLKNSVPFPPPSSTNVAQEGRPGGFTTERAGAGKPLAVTAKEVALPAVIASEAALVNCGAASAAGEKPESDTTNCMTMFAWFFVLVATACSSCD